MNTNITDLEKYNQAMTLSLIDKIYFIDKINNVDTYIDFGCADGTLIKFMNRLFPDKRYYGYDNNKDMIEIAKDGVESNNIIFDTKLPDSHERHLYGKTCLILSSVIHEVYSYGPAAVDDFWNQIWDFSPDYIAIRDMMVSSKTSRPASKKLVARVRQLTPKYIIDQWEAQWGSLDENWSLIHFFLTYRYQENWEREYRENYLPIAYEELLNLIPREYDIHFSEHYTLPYLAGEVWKNFYIQLQDPTHIKLILRKVKNGPPKSISFK